MNKLTKNQHKNLNMGYCCINTVLRKQKIFTSRTCRLATIQKNGIEHSYELTKQNLRDLELILKWNYDHGIKLFRLSSDMFPFATHQDYRENYDLLQFESTLRSLGDLAKKYGQTLTMHPSQFNQLTSKRESVINNTIFELNFSAKILDLMDVGKDGVIVVHGGSKQDGKEIALQRFCQNFMKLSKSAQQRLVVENCELVYSIHDLLPISKKLQIPIVIDFHHHNLNNEDNLVLSELITDALEIWKAKGITPLFHVSECREGVLPTDSITVRRAHGDFVNSLPKELLDLVSHTKVNLDVEAKMKEQAVLRLRDLYCDD